MAHEPVLLEKTLEYLQPRPGKFFVDGTVNGGSHAAAILEKIGPHGKLLGVDWDPDMLRQSRERFRGKRNVILAEGNYNDLSQILQNKKLPLADGLLLDLGFSSNQLTAGRGFSFAAEDEELRMTYSPERTPAYRLLRELSEPELADVIWRLGGERFSRRIAKSIKSAGRPIRTVRELKQAILRAVPRGYERGRIDPATRTFQALRIYANDELSNLSAVLKALPQIVRPSGRIVILSFHSLEDGEVKRKFKEMEKEGQIRILTKKPIVPTREEEKNNPRSRSARLRAAELA